MAGLPRRTVSVLAVRPCATRALRPRRFGDVSRIGDRVITHRVQRVLEDGQVVSWGDTLPRRPTFADFAREDVLGRCGGSSGVRTAARRRAAADRAPRARRSRASSRALNRGSVFRCRRSSRASAGRDLAHTACKVPRPMRVDPSRAGAHEDHVRASDDEARADARKRRSKSGFIVDELDQAERALARIERAIGRDGVLGPPERRDHGEVSIVDRLHQHGLSRRQGTREGAGRLLVTAPGEPGWQTERTSWRLGLRGRATRRSGDRGRGSRRG